MKLLYIAIASLLFLGCSKNLTHPIKLGDEPFSPIHMDLFKKASNDVPIDVSLSNKNWKYRLKVKYKNGYFLTNTQVMKTFYLAHHADLIVIKGNKHLITKYEKYFLNNGVKAYIKLVHKRTSSKNVTITLSHRKKYLKE